MFKPLPAAALACILLFHSFLARANNYIVNTSNDSHALLPLVSALDANGSVSLRSAIESADAIGGTHTITLGNAIYTITLGQIVFGNQAVNITLTGNGPANTIIDMTTGAGKDRIFLLNPTGLTDDIVLSVTGVKFQNGYLTSDPYGGAAITSGGGIGNALTLTNCAFQNNIVPAGSGTGGAINQVISGDLTITNCSFTNNQDNDADGGAVYFYVQTPSVGQPAFAGNLIITGSTFTGNGTSNRASGGAIAVAGTFSFTNNFNVAIEKNTFTANTAAGQGGAISINSSYGPGGQVDIHYNRFAGNSSSDVSTSGVAMFDGGGDVSLTNNWWGCNSGPDFGGNCDRAAVVGFISLGTLTTAPWLQLKASAPDISGCPNSNATTTVTASFLSNSANAPVSVSNIPVLIGLPVSFVNPGLGTLSNPDATIQPTGSASVTFTSNGTSGTGTVNAVVDNVPGNDPVAKASFSISLDNTPPSISCPEPLTVQCATMVPAPDITQVISNGTVSFVSDVISNQTCVNKYTLTRTYRATDACGNSSTCAQTITVNDDTPPSITAPAAVSVSCSAAVPAHDFTGGSASDNCGTVNVTWEADQVVNQVCTNRFTILRKYRATDACNNSTEATQTITVNDNQGPVITCPANLTVQCGSNVPAHDFAGGSASDNCGTVNVTWISDVISNQTCVNKYSITRTYKAADACGNETTCTQTITVNDNTAPVISGCVNIEVNPENLNGTVVTYTTPTATDNCGTPTVSFVSGLPSGSTFPIGVTTVDYEAQDICGNVSTCSFTVTVNNPYCSTHKVYVCHNGNTICISTSALSAHISHGDLLGPCSWYNFSRVTTDPAGNAQVKEQGKQTMKAESNSIKVPEQFSVSTYPNPFMNETRIRYEIPEESKVSIVLYDLKGRQVKTILNTSRKPGSYSETLSASGLTAGIYYYKFVAVTQKNKVEVRTQKISILK